jgi:ABC-2 type transport system permease protein
MNPLKRFWQIYQSLAQMAILNQFQYRVAHYFYTIGMITEPVVYLVVWTTIANARGSAVGGYTAPQFAAYYIIWTLVRSMNITFTPYGWEWRIRQGTLNGMLTRPFHPLHEDIAYFLGMKIPTIIMWLPIAAVLTWAFKPEFYLSWWQILGFFITIWGAFLIRTMWMWALGLITFWTTRVGAIFEMYFMIELLFSGRLVPLSLFPPWVQTVAVYLPFQWAFQFPIEILVKPITPQYLLWGLAMQLLWILLGLLVVRLTWNTAVRRYSAVGG